MKLAMIGLKCIADVARRRKRKGRNFQAAIQIDIDDERTCPASSRQRPSPTERSFNDLVRAQQLGLRHSEAERLGGLEVDGKREYRAGCSNARMAAHPDSLSGVRLLQRRESERATQVIAPFGRVASV
jgi:hypothetical protein